MKKILYPSGYYNLNFFLTFLLIISGISIFAQDARYVDSTAGNDVNDGQSWLSAYKTFGKALDDAQKTPTIKNVFIAKGTYSPTHAPYEMGTDKVGVEKTGLRINDNTFHIRTGLSIYGGYPSGGGLPNEKVYPSILSGLGIYYHVVLIDSSNNWATANDTAKMEGITVTGGLSTANTSITQYDAIYDGFSLNGIGVYRNSGAGIWISNGTIVINKTTITSNTAGGQVGFGHSYGSGGGIYMKNGSFIKISNSNISNNTTISNSKSECDAAGLRLNATNVIISQTTINKNIAGGFAGGMEVTSTSLNVTQCTFSNNIGYNNSGGLNVVSSGNYSISQTSFINNISNAGFNGNGGMGGGIYISGGTGNISECYISGNVSNAINSGFGNKCGSGIYLLNGTCAINRSNITGNLVGTSNPLVYTCFLGPGVFVDGCNFTSTNSIYNLNNGDGAIYITGGGTNNIINNTFYGNKNVNNPSPIATALVVTAGSSANFKNNIVWGNAGNAGKILSNSGILNSAYNIGQDMNIGATSNNMICTGSMGFIDSISNVPNLGILPTSVAVDKGDTNNISQYIGTTDFAGNNRFTGNQIDLGAYEYNVSCPIASNTTTVTSNVWGNAANYINNACTPMLAIQPMGANPLVGNVTIKETIDASVQTYNGHCYGTRHYDVEPTNNPSTATANITLYFTQADFDAFNAYPNKGASLPTGPTDVANKANISIMQYHGTSPNNLPGSYTDYNGTNSTKIEIAPGASNVLWNGATNNWEVRFTVTGFSGFFLANNGQAILPVSLLSFTATPTTDKSVLLNWLAAEQVNVKNYSVEHSSDGSQFFEIGSVEANNLSSFNYQFKDVNPNSGTNFYRLKIVDIDGSIKYGTTISITTNGIQQATTLYPQPAASYVMLKGDVSLLGKNAELLDMQGKGLQQFTIRQLPQKIETEQLASGIYWLKINNGETIKLIVQKNK